MHALIIIAIKSSYVLQNRPLVGDVRKELESIAGKEIGIHRLKWI